MGFRNVAILAACQALGLSGASLILLTGGILGSSLTPQKTLATLPVTLMVVGVALFSIPAAMLMKRVGRKRGFILASIIAAAASLAAAYGIQSKNFWLYSAALLFIGGNLAFMQQYRFAAAESVESRYVGKAISFVLVGGILAGYLGPRLGTLARDWFSSAAFTGSYLLLACLYGAATILLTFSREVAVAKAETERSERGLLRVVSQPAYLVALMAGTVAYGVMGFIMTATPISMHVMDGFDVAHTASVIQAHVMAMYVPSLFSGFIVDRFGPKNLTIIGTLSMGAAVAINLLSAGFTSYLVALIALGLGWNFLFVGGSFLLSLSYHPRERFKAQAVNEFSIFAVQAIATLSAGTVIGLAGWRVVNFIALPVLLPALVVLLVFKPPASPHFSRQAATQSRTHE